MTAKFRSTLREFSHSSTNINEYASSFPSNLSALDLNWEAASDTPQATPEELSDTIHRIERLYKHREHSSSSRDLRTVCQALWQPPFALAENSKFREPFLENIRRLPINSPLRALAKQYLEDWPVSEREDGPIGQFLRSQRSRMTSGWLLTAKKNRLFDRGEGIHHIAERLLSDTGRIDGVLRQSGLSGKLVAGRYAEAVFTAACQTCTDSTEREAVQRLLSFATPGSVAWTNVRFQSPAAKSALISLLLGAGQIEVPLIEKRWRVTQLLRLFDDPRIRPARWQDVDPRLVDLTKQWLAKESLEQFLKVISDSLTNPDDRRRWKYRRAFWSSYVDSGRVTEAWVHFGPNAERVAARLRARTGEEIPYGLFDSTNKDHSVILMRAGDAVITEYANIGKCWIWPSAKDRHAPKLYQRRQYETLCRDAPFGQIHSSADSYNWQRQVADHLKSLGIPSTPQSQWVPR